MTYLLLPLVIAIWSGVIFRYFFPSREAWAMKKTVHSPLKTVESVSDTFSLSLNYQDPFGKLETQAKKKNIAPAEIHPATYSPKPIPAPQMAEPLPKFEYHGLAGNPKKDIRIALISANGKMISLSPGEESEGLLLLGAWEDSVLISFKSTKKTIALK